MAGFGGGDAPVAFALSAGVITAFNPCGFAMLPAYVSYFVGSTTPVSSSGGAEAAAPDPLAARLLKAATVGAMVTLGFVTVFGLIGILASSARSRVNDAVPWISMVVGVVLTVLGIAMLRGFEPKLSFLTVKRAQHGNGLRSMYLYGLSYAIVSLSCGFAGFTTAVVSSFESSSFLAGVEVYLAFALGMGLVLIVLSFAVALAQQAVVRRMRAVLPYVNRVSGFLLILAGVYVAYYGYFEWRTVVLGQSAPEGPVAWVTSWSASIQNWVDGLSTTALVAAGVVIAGVVVASVAAVRARRTIDGDRPMA